MVYKDSVEDLLKEGLIKRCPVDEKAVLLHADKKEKSPA